MIKAIKNRIRAIGFAYALSVLQYKVPAAQIRYMKKEMEHSLGCRFVFDSILERYTANFDRL